MTTAWFTLLSWLALVAACPLLAMLVGWIAQRLARAQQYADGVKSCAGGKPIYHDDIFGRCHDCVWTGKLGCPKVPGAREDGLPPTDGVLATSGEGNARNTLRVPGKEGGRE